MKKIIIVGGGVAGLSALNRLADLGVSATLIEAGDYPSHKICGEFFSPGCLPILNNWDLEPVEKIDRMSFITKNRALSFSLPVAARSQSRFDFDVRLVERAEKMGATVITKTKVKEIREYDVVLENGETLPHTDLIMSSGRLFATPPLFRYVGLKAHFKGIDIQNTLELYSFSGGYGGLSPIENGCANFTCLMPISDDNKDQLLQKLFEEVPQLQERLQKGDRVYDEWMMSKVPQFGIKQTPAWPNTYFIGDAAGTVPPASGLGLSLAITSGYMAAEYVMKGNYQGFRKAWVAKYKKSFTYAHLLHRFMMSPSLSNSAIMLGKLFTTLPETLFMKTRF